jgi:hypothetical protein
MECMANPTTPVLLRLARNMCSTIINLQIGSDALQKDAFELMRLLGGYEASILAPPGYSCGCGSGAIRLRDGEPLCFTCWMTGREFPRNARLNLQHLRRTA